MRRALMALPLVLAACSGGGDGPFGPLDGGGQDADAAGDSGPVPLSLELGAGELAYAPIEPDDTLTLIHGPQGGYHVLLAVRLRGADESSLILSFRETRLRDGLQVSDPAPIESTSEAYDHVGGWAVKAGLFVILNPGLGPTDVVGEELETIATLIDGRGEEASASARYGVAYEEDEQ